MHEVECPVEFPSNGDVPFQAGGEPHENSLPIGIPIADGGELRLVRIRQPPLQVAKPAGEERFR